MRTFFARAAMSVSAALLCGALTPACKQRVENDSQVLDTFTSDRTKVLHKGKGCNYEEQRENAAAPDSIPDSIWVTCYDEDFSPRRQCNYVWYYHGRQETEIKFSIEVYVGDAQSTVFEKNLKTLGLLNAEMVRQSAQGWMETYCGDPAIGNDGKPATTYTRIAGKVKLGATDCEYTEIRFDGRPMTQVPDQIDVTCYPPTQGLRRQCNYAWRAEASGGNVAFDIQEYDGDNPTVQTEVFALPKETQALAAQGVAAAAQKVMDAHCATAGKQ